MFDTEMWYKNLDDQFFEDVMDAGKLSTKMNDIEMELIKPQHFNFTKGRLVGNIYLHNPWCHVHTMWLT